MWEGMQFYFEPLCALEIRTSWIQCTQDECLYLLKLKIQVGSRVNQSVLDLEALLLLFKMEKRAIFPSPSTSNYSVLSYWQMHFRMESEILNNSIAAKIETDVGFRVSIRSKLGLPSWSKRDCSRAREKEDHSKYIPLFPCLQDASK